MIVVISQSMYFPWAGLLEQVRLADIFVHYDDVQYARGFLNRVQIKTAEGQQWMTVPLSGLKRGQQIDEVKIDEASGWRKRHRTMLRHAYSQTPYFGDMMSLFDQALSAPSDSLADVSRASLVALARHPGIGAMCQFVRSEDLNVPASGSTRILDIVKALGGTTYVTGHGGRNYLDHEAFENAGIEVRYMNYQVGPYPQSNGPFSPYVSALDLIANCGIDSSRHLHSETIDWKEPYS